MKWVREGRTTRASAPLLDRLNDGRVFSVERTEDGTFMVGEECDRYFGEKLTAEELSALGREIVAAAATK